MNAAAKLDASDSDGADMTSTLPVTRADDHDFETIEAAVMETTRGRWFLGEYARRLRAAETAKVLAAITRLERSLTSDKADAAPMAQSELTDAVALIEGRLSEIAWSLRERGFDGRTCAEIEAQARALKQLVNPQLISAGSAPVVAVPPSAPQIQASVAVVPTVVAAPIAPAAPPAMPSIVLLNTKAADIRDPSETSSFMSRALRSLAEIDAMDDRARARLFG